MGDVYIIVLAFVVLSFALGFVAGLIEDRWPWLGHYPLCVAVALSVAASIPVTLYVLERM